MGSLEVVGPFNPAGLSETPSRKRIFVCRPGSAADAREEVACATKIFSTLARRAFRRPVTESDLEAPLAFYTTARETGDFDTAIRDGLTTILASPKFLFRAERLPEGSDSVAPGAVYRITDLELASRLAFFLSGRPPDDELLDVAEKGRLADARVLDAQVTAAAGRTGLKVARHELRVPMAARARRSTTSIRTAWSFPTSTTACARRSGKRSSSSWRAFCARTGASWTC